MKGYNNNEESSYIQYLDANNLYGWAMSKKLPTNGFKWLNTSETSNKTAEPSAKHIINEDFIKNYNENDTKGYILEVDVKYPKRLHELQVIYRSYQNEWKLISVKNSFVIYLTRKNM